MSRGVVDKWRPSLGLVLSLVLGTVLVLPLAGLSLSGVQGLSAERGSLILGGAVVLLVAAALGLVLHRTISAPVRDLVRLTRAIGDGDRAALVPGRHQGTREFADLSRSVLAVADRLTRRSAAVSSFAAHVSHELKSPLTAIRGAAELLRDDLDDRRMSEDERRRFLDTVAADAGRLDALLGRLREMARAEGPGLAGDTTLGPVLETLRDRFDGLALHAVGDLGLRLAIPSETAAIVLSHLADNAVRHGAGRLDVSVATNGGSVRIEVRDDGGGISPGNRPRIFDSFFTTRREEGGTGMGLAIVRAMLGAYGGTIALIDTERGAGFALDMPVADEPGHDDPRSAPASRRTAGAVVLGLIATGLVLRGFGPAGGLPFWFTKYGGSILWGAMIYGVATFAAPALPLRQRAAMSFALALAVELSRLVHAPALDAFRLTTAGALLLGRVFSTSNILLYALGIAGLAGTEAALGRQPPVSKSPG